jgi:triacylglycerol lipase
MRIATRPFAACALILLGACGSITDPMDPLAKRNPPPPPPPPTHPIILFVHGWNANASTWTTMIGRFKTDGWQSSELSAFSYDFSKSNATTAAIIKGKVDSIRKARGSVQVAIVTHSMGTLSARYYVRNLGGDGLVSALVSLGGANHGTQTAQLCFQISCQEMWPNSSFLAALNSTDETWGTPRYATWWSPCDQVIKPNSSTLLDGATNTETACLQHSQLHEDATVYSQVRDFINQPVAAAIVAAR